jgi:platelet-activating factor acetylhydrolase IB subunit alpha
VIGASKTAAAFRDEAGIPESFDDATAQKYEGLLPKKWTSVVRLQKKVAHPRNNTSDASFVRLYATTNMA